MSDPSPAGHDAPSRDLAWRVDGLCDRFEAAWRAGERPRIEDYLAELPAGGRPALLRHLVALDADYRWLRGERPQPQEYCDRFPSLDPAWVAREVGGAAAELAAPSTETPVRSMPQGAPGDTTPYQRPAGVARSEPTLVVARAGPGALGVAELEALLQRRLLII